MILSLIPFFFAKLVLSSSVENDQCGLYMAISSSSTAEVTKWGVFAGKEIPEGTPIGYPEVGVNVPNLRSNTIFLNDDEEEIEYLDRIVTMFETLFWVAETIGAKYEQTAGRAVAAIPGIGVLGTYNKRLTNAEWNISQTYHRTAIGEMSGVSHPGRGAVSPFYSAQTMSSKSIKAGSEIFMEFGESWAEQNDESEDDDLSDDDFEKIDATIEQILKFYESHKNDLDEQSKAEVYRFVTNDVLKAAVGTKKARRISKILPPSPDELLKVQQAGGALSFSDPTIYRNVDWLSQYGFCMDNIRPGASTIPNAGRGAFATRKIAKGNLVAPVPLSHFPDNRILNMYELSLNIDGDFERHSSKVVGRQLLENYCYGHPESSMIFFPSGAVVALINHSDEPNARLIWSKHPSHHRQWFEQDPKELAEESNAFVGLIMEVVATRDIQPGEEVFIDYGPEWKAAWEKHVSEWETKIQHGEIPSSWPIRAVEMNSKYISTPFETPEELVEPYPDNVDLKAFLMLADTTNAGTLDDPKEWDAQDAISHDNLFSVSIVHRTKIEGTDQFMPYIYTVSWTGDSSTTVIAGVPHSALVFVDRPGTSDQFTPAAFRHSIGIPDDIFPQGPWRNMKKN